MDRPPWTLIAIRKVQALLSSSVSNIQCSYQVGPLMHIPYSSKFSWHNILVNFVNFVINLEMTKILKIEHVNEVAFVLYRR